MKTSIKSILAIAFNVLMLFSCKKTDQIQPVDQLQLVNDQTFRNYVANDMYLVIQNTLQNATSLDKQKNLQFREELKFTKEADLQSVFAKHKIDFASFQQYHLKRYINQVKVLHALPEIAKLPESEINNLFKTAYENISSKISFQLITVSSKSQPQKMALKMNEKSINPTKSGINTQLISEDYMYFSSEDEIPMSEDMAIEQLTILVQSYAVAHDITVVEAMNCLKQAVGWGFGAMGGIIGWSKGIAGLAIQDVVIVATRFAMRYIGWIGLAVTTYSLTSCLIDAY